MPLLAPAVWLVAGAWVLVAEAGSDKRLNVVVVGEQDTGKSRLVNDVLKGLGYSSQAELGPWVTENPGGWSKRRWWSLALPAKLGIMLFYQDRKDCVRAKPPNWTGPEATCTYFLYDQNVMKLHGQPNMCLSGGVGHWRITQCRSVVPVRFFKKAGAKGTACLESDPDVCLTTRPPQRPMTTHIRRYCSDDVCIFDTPGYDVCCGRGNASCVPREKLTGALMKGVAAGSKLYPFDEHPVSELPVSNDRPDVVILLSRQNCSAALRQKYGPWPVIWYLPPSPESYNGIGILSHVAKLCSKGHVPPRNPAAPADRLPLGDSSLGAPGGKAGGAREPGGKAAAPPKEAAARRGGYSWRKLPSLSQLRQEYYGSVKPRLKRLARSAGKTVAAAAAAITVVYLLLSLADDGDGASPAARALRFAVELLKAATSPLWGPVHHRVVLAWAAAANSRAKQKLGAQLKQNRAAFAPRVSVARRRADGVDVLDSVSLKDLTDSDAGEKIRGFGVISPYAAVIGVEPTRLAPRGVSLSDVLYQTSSLSHELNLRLYPDGRIPQLPREEDSCLFCDSASHELLHPVTACVAAAKGAFLRTGADLFAESVEAAIDAVLSPIRRFIFGPPPLWRRAWTGLKAYAYKYRPEVVLEIVQVFLKRYTPEPIYRRLAPIFTEIMRVIAATFRLIRDTLFSMKDFVRDLGDQVIQFVYYLMRPPAPDEEELERLEKVVRRLRKQRHADDDVSDSNSHCSDLTLWSHVDPMDEKLYRMHHTMGQTTRLLQEVESNLVAVNKMDERWLHERDISERQAMEKEMQAGVVTALTKSLGQFRSKARRRSSARPVGGFVETANLAIQTPKRMIPTARPPVARIAKMRKQVGKRYRHQKRTLASKVFDYVGYLVWPWAFQDDADVVEFPTLSSSESEADAPFVDPDLTVSDYSLDVMNADADQVVHPLDPLIGRTPIPHRVSRMLRKRRMEPAYPTLAGNEISHEAMSLDDESTSAPSFANLDGLYG
ncbi:hypothetical protein DIPPA_24373 [Diplonema papillatum]|nr:hypothetical protein DIPPA_24373 [Diplonema papillatum]